MQTSAAWMSDTPPLACLSGLAHREALQRLRDDPAARAEMTASAQWSAAHRWADQWATTDQAYYVALRRGFAAQCDIQRGVMTLAGAERWALPDRQPARLSYFESRAATPLRGADIGPPTFAGDWIRGWLADLERHILPAPPTTAAYSALMTAGVDLLTWLANHLSQIPEGVGAEDQSLRAIRRAWSEFAPPGVSRVQTDSIRRLYLGTVANGHRSGRTVGIVQWVSRGRRIEQARAVPQLAMSWAVSVDQADPAIAVLSRDALKRRQKLVRTQTGRRLGSTATPPDLELRRADPTRAVAASTRLPSPRRTASGPIPMAIVDRRAIHTSGCRGPTSRHAHPACAMGSGGGGIRAMAATAPARRRRRAY
jgi:hypothetical protein